MKTELTQDKRFVRYKNYKSNNVNVKYLESSIGDKIKELRILNGLNQEDIGKLFNVSARCISKYEKGQTKITVATLYDYAVLFRVKITDLLPTVDRMIKYDSHGKLSEKGDSNG